MMTRPRLWTLSAKAFLTYPSLRVWTTALYVGDYPLHTNGKGLRSAKSGNTTLTRTSRHPVVLIFLLRGVCEPAGGYQLVTHTDLPTPISIAPRYHLSLQQAEHHQHTRQRHNSNPKIAAHVRYIYKLMSRSSKGRSARQYEDVPVAATREEVCSLSTYAILSTVCVAMLRA